jgi:hypothetical protein
MKITFPVFAELGKRAVPFVIRFVIRDIAKRRAGKDLSNSIELRKGKILHAEEQWKDLLSYIRSTLNVQEELIPADETSNLTPPEAAL